MGKTTGVICVALLALGMMAFGAGPGDRDARARNKVEGTWEHTSRPELRHVKVINQDHFIWVTSLRETKEAVLAAGGSYTLEGDTYTEMVEFGRFGTDEMQKGVGKAQPFKVKVEGDTLTMTADLANGQRFHEVWKRIR